MKKTIKKLVILFAVLFSSAFMRAQFAALGYVEYGYAMNKFKSPEFLTFLHSYNEYESTQGLKEKFDEQIKMASGDYFKFGIGFGGEAAKVIFDFGILKARSKPYSARFADGTGRDMIVDLRNSNSDVGVRFGGTEKFPLWIQLDMNILIQVVSIESYYVFADGSKSFGDEHTLNGIYRDNIMTGGLGCTMGSKIVGPLNVFVHADYIPNFGKSHPEYHIYDDLTELKSHDPLNDWEYLPRDMAAYAAGDNYSDNAISDDMAGWHFGAGIQLCFGTKPE